VMTVASAAVAGTSRNRALGPVAVVVSILSAVAAVYWTGRTGDAGAGSVWGGGGGRAPGPSGEPPSPATAKPAPASRVEAGKAAPEPVAGGLSLLTAAAGAVRLTVLVATLDETYESVQAGDGLARVDRPLLDWMVAHRSPGLDAVI